MYVVLDGIYKYTTTILYYILQLYLYYNYMLPYEISYFRALWV
jgi:hypothetical protein